VLYFIYCYILSFCWKDYSDNFVVCSQNVYDVGRPHSEYGFIQRWQTYTLHISELPLMNYMLLSARKEIINVLHTELLQFFWVPCTCYEMFTWRKLRKIYIPYYCTHPGSSVLRRLWWVMENPLSDFSCTFGNCNATQDTNQPFMAS